MRELLTARLECELQLVPRGPARGLEREGEQALRRATPTGRPCGLEAFVRALEGRLGHRPYPGKRDPKPQTAAEALDE